LTEKTLNLNLIVEFRYSDKFENSVNIRFFNGFIEALNLVFQIFYWFDVL